MSGVPFFFPLGRPGRLVAGYIFSTKDQWPWPSVNRPQFFTIFHSRVVVEVHNTGNAPLVTPTVTVKATEPAPAGTFQLANDHVTGGADLASGAFRTVDVVFTPNAAGQFSGTLTVTATNLSSPKTIQPSGTGTGP